MSQSLPLTDLLHPVYHNIRNFSTADYKFHKIRKRRKFGGPGDAAKKSSGGFLPRFSAVVPVCIVVDDVVYMPDPVLHARASIAFRTLRNGVRYGEREWPVVLIRRAAFCAAVFGTPVSRHRVSVPRRGDVRRMMRRRLGCIFFDGRGILF